MTSCATTQTAKVHRKHPPYPLASLRTHVSPATRFPMNGRGTVPGTRPLRSTLARCPAVRTAHQENDLLPDLTALIALLLGLMQMGGPRPDTAHTLVGTVVCMLIGGAFTRMALGRGLRALEEDELLVAEVSARWAVTWGFLGWLGCLFFFNWGAWVNDAVPRMWWLGRYLVLFLPALVLFANGWAARARLEAEVVTRRGGVPLPSEPWAAIRRGFRKNAIAFLPLFVVMGITDGIWVLGRLGIEPLRRASLWQEAMPLLDIGFVMLIVLATLPFVPRIFARILKAGPMAPGRTREVLERAAASIKLRYRDILVWPTRAPNAMVVGFTPRSRTIFMTQGLLDGLTEDEVLAVFFHEAGHAKRQHLPLFIAMFFSLSLVFYLGRDVFVALGLGIELQLVLHLGVLWFILLGWISRRFERESDIYGAEHAAFMTPDAPPLYVPGLLAPLPHGAALMMRALERVRSIAGHSYSHRHGSIEDRVSYVAQHATDPDVRASFQRARRALLTGIFAFIGLAVTATAYSLPTEVAHGRANVDADGALMAYKQAWRDAHSKDAARSAQADARYREAFDGFLGAAARVEKRNDPRSQLMAVNYHYKAGDVALHGLGQPDTAAPWFEKALAGLGDQERSGPFLSELEFRIRVSLGRIEAWRQAARPVDERDMTAAREHLRAARTIKISELDTAAALSADQRDYFDESLRLLVATQEAARGEAAQARKALKALTQIDRMKQGWKNQPWIELAENARTELARIDGP